MQGRTGRNNEKANSGTLNLLDKNITAARQTARNEDATALIPGAGQTAIFGVRFRCKIAVRLFAARTTTTTTTGKPCSAERLLKFHGNVAARGLTPRPALCRLLDSST